MCIIHYLCEVKGRCVDREREREKEETERERYVLLCKDIEA